MMSAGGGCGGLINADLYVDTHISNTRIYIYMHTRIHPYMHVRTQNKKTYPSKIVFLEKQMDSLPLDKIDKVIYASADKHCFGQNMIAVSDESIAEKWAPRLNDDHWQKTTDSPNIVSDV